MSYLTRNLLNSEVIVCQSYITKYSYISAILYFIAGYIIFKLPNVNMPYIDASIQWVSRICIISSIFTFISVFIEIYSTEIIVTNKRIIFKKGLISRNINELSLLKIEKVNIKQGIIERIFDIGDVYISGTGGGMIKITDIDKPMMLYRAIMQSIDDRI